MKFAERWLKDWVKSTHDAAALGERLTSIGLELDGLSTEAGDTVLELGITANRGDCLSIRGVAREVGVSEDLPVTPPDIKDVPVKGSTTKIIHIVDPKFCPRYLARIIEGVNARTATPDIIATRLRQSGLNTVNIIVDILNYVMLEWGQPLHAFDLKTLKGDIHVRLSKGEMVTLLDNRTVRLDPTTWVIADDTGPVALAGVMGTAHSAVTDATQSVLLESAFFNPAAIMGKARVYGVSSDAATRFERGVDYELPATALARATELILQYAGGSACPVVKVETPAALPARAPIALDVDKLCKLLGMCIPVAQIQGILKRLGFQVEVLSEGKLRVIPPSYRFDISITEDLYEEVLRIVGFNQVPEALPPIKAAPTPTEAWHSLGLIKQQLLARGYDEVITYSFVDENLQEQILGKHPVEKLLNPISPDMNVMRLSIWPGLIQTLRYNQNRQYLDMKIMEIGQCFRRVEEELTFDEYCAGLISGQAAPLYWDGTKRPLDFYDIKGDVEALLNKTGCAYRFENKSHPALHPGISAAIFQGADCVGWVGALHPGLALALDIKTPTFLFEVKLTALQQGRVPKAKALSKFPHVRRDIALVLDKSIPSEKVVNTIKGCAGPLLTQVEVFDLYQGKNMDPGKKSLALALILQESSRTLIDTEVNDLMQVVVTTLVNTLQATVRE